MKNEKLHQKMHMLKTQIKILYDLKKLSELKELNKKKTDQYNLKSSLSDSFYFYT